MYKIGEDEMVSCPYNRYHIVSKLRIQKHIIKCKKNYPDVKLATCFYNHTHRLKPEDMLQHYEICSHKTRLDGAKYYENFSSSTCNSSVENLNCSNKCPDIDVKPRFLDDPKALSPSLKQNSDYSDFTDLESKRKEEFSFDEGDSDDDLETFSLPRTVSRVSMSVSQRLNDVPETLQFKNSGRGKYFMAFAPKSPSSQLATDSHGRSVDVKDKNLEISSKSSCCNMTVTSSMFDETSSFRSEEIIFDEEDNDETSEGSFILKNFDKYINI